MTNSSNTTSGSSKSFDERQWTPLEVLEAVEYIKNTRPDVWQELERIEKASGDFTFERSHAVQCAMLAQLHPGVHHIDITNLAMAVRTERRRLLGLPH